MTHDLNMSTGNGASRGSPGMPGASAGPSDLETVLPQGHPARLCWEFASTPTVASELLRVSKGAPSSVSLFAAWLLATSRGVGSAEELSWLCRNSVGFRWLLGGVSVDARGFAAFRELGAAAIDDLLARSLIALRNGGATRDDLLLAQVTEARRHVAALRLRIADPLGDRVRRRERTTEARRAARAARVENARAGFERIAVAREAEARRQDEARQAERRQEERRLAEAQRAAELKAAELKAVEPRAAEPKAAAGRPAEAVLRAAAVAAREAPRAASAARTGPRRFVSMSSLDWGGAGDTADGQFKHILTATLLVFCLTTAMLLMIKPPPVERKKDEAIPQRLTKLFEEQKAKPKIELPKLQEIIKPKELLPKDDKPAEGPTAEAKPAPKAEAKVAARPDAVKAGKPVSEEVAVARERASRTGLVAMRDQLAAMRDLSGSGDALRSEQTRVGTEGTQRQVERDLIGKAATSGSGGVATKTIAHAGGGSLEGRSTARVSGPAGGTGGGAPSLAEIEKESKGGKRTAEEIKLAFDANKSAIYGIYRRALRENPLLEGRVVLRLTIDPAGNVTACTITSSGLKAPDLEAKLVARVMLINFGTRPKLETWTGTYLIDFVPSS